MSRQPGQVPLNSEGASRTEPGIGPSDSSDLPTELPESVRDIDTDRYLTGERPAVEERPNIASGEDVDVDRDVSEDEAGLAHTPPDPARNGGTPED